MPRENSTRYALLGLLTTSCRTGYEMKQMIDHSLNHFWKISFGQVYPTLKALEQDGLIVLSNEEDDRKAYELTESGETELRRWLEEKPAELPVQRNELLLKLFFARHEPLEETIEKITHHEALLRGRLETYEAIETMIRSSETQSPDAMYWLMTLDYGKTQTRALIEWCERTVRMIEGGTDDETEDGRTE
ncbi:MULTISPECIES: PadR family transcriptional regulator [Exiguobacterium]|uniref:PadR family transcriptional regulator n=1 Tax=Exiguobacterium TaxID=33986 RepID=UPI0004A94686|nr:MULTISPECIES: PadR family transcriptional regulator [Exiguobacterium]KDN58373.1 transcriptional regulator [Exiguobacterium sp. AB2]MCT4781974.1 PadR family transcriptional regulator [Exiguobacterium himgiriensis]